MWCGDLRRRFGRTRPLGVDRDGAIRLVDSALDNDVERFVMRSEINANTPIDSPETLHEYLSAKAEADEYLRATDLQYTIVRPTSLNNEPGTGTIETGSDLDCQGAIPAKTSREHPLQR